MCDGVSLSYLSRLELTRAGPCCQLAIRFLVLCALLPGLIVHRADFGRWCSSLLYLLRLGHLSPIIRMRGQVVGGDGRYRPLPNPQR